MISRVTLYLNNRIIARAQEIAARSGREVEDVLADWISAYADNFPLETLSNQEILTLCDYELNPVYKYELDQLLSRHRDYLLDYAEMARLDEICSLHRKGIVRKSRALQVAAARGLMTNLPQDNA
jgi:hypothetical protein